MKRILFILHTPPPVHGSSVVGKYIKESKIINKAFECKYINLGTSYTVDEIGRNPIKKISRYFSIIIETINLLLRFKPEMCYMAITIKGIGFYKDSLIALLVKLFGVKIVYHFHNKGVATRQNKTTDNLLYRRVFKNTNTILLSKYLYQDVEKYFSKEQIFTCPNGIPDIENISEIIKNKKEEESNEKVEILFLSNLIESKGVFILLEACEILKNRNLSFHCTFVGGEGDVSANVFQQKVKKLNLENYVEYVGKKYDEEKIEVFSNADIFAFPTYYHNETFGLVNLEAMQYSIPVVSTFEGGIPDVIDDGITGFLVPQKNAIALAEKLELLINDPTLRLKMGEAGRIKYEKEFTIDVFEKNMNGILKKNIRKLK